MSRCLSWFAVLLLVPAARADKLVLFAGGGSEIDNVPAIKAKLDQPFGIDFDMDGNAFIVELVGGRVLKVNPKGLLTVVAGSKDKGDAGDNGPANKAAFNGMHALAVNDVEAVLVHQPFQAVNSVALEVGGVEMFGLHERHAEV